MRRVTAVFVALLFVSMTTYPALGANSKAMADKKTPTIPPQKATPEQLRRPNFGLVLGSVTRIDAKDPARPVIEVKSNVDDTVHTIEIAPGTNITKVTDISELKVGDAVRVMTRKIDAKEVAMGVMFGNIKNIPQRPAIPPPAPKK